jgi:hypothetical protein
MSEQVPTKDQLPAISGLIAMTAMLARLEDRKLRSSDPLYITQLCAALDAARDELAETKRLLAMIDPLLNHCDKDGGECHMCGQIVCPHKDPLHFHHDGCPACSQESP